MENRSFASSGESESTAMEDMDALRSDVECVLTLTQAYVDQAGEETEWEPDPGNYQTLLAMFAANLRSILIRQFESLEVILDLVGRNKGAVAGPLLRPTCEEFIWVKYLASISPSDAENILRLAGLEEIYDSLTAVDETAGNAATEELGLKPHLEQVRKYKDKRHDALNEIAEELGWPKGKRKTPSVYWLAKRTGEEYVYGIVYHATSRFAHFSVAELARRVWWNKPDRKLSISSSHFGDHWNRFCLHWGALLFIYTMREILGFRVIREDDRDAGRNKIDLPSVERIGERIEKRGSPPIISSRELAWPDERAD